MDGTYIQCDSVFNIKPEMQCIEKKWKEKRSQRTSLGARTMCNFYYFLFSTYIFIGIIKYMLFERI